MRGKAIGLVGMLASALAAQEISIPMEPLQIERLGIEMVQPRLTREIPLGYVPAMVTVPPQAEVLVSAPVAGRIEEVRVARGEAVAARQLLVKINSPELLAAQQRLLAAQQEFKVAHAGYLREKPLFQDGVIAKSRFLETEKLFRQAQVTLAQTRAELVALGVPEAAVDRMVRIGKLDSRLALFAPMAGVITAREVTVGQWVDRLAPLLRLTATSTLWLEMAAPVALAERLSLGAPVQVESYGAKGTIFLIGGTVDPASQTVLVRAELNQPKGLMPGRNVTAALFQLAPETLLEIPRSALVEHQGEQYVFVRTPEGFQLRRIDVTAQTQEAAFVAGGLEATAQLVSRGTAALKAAWLGTGEEE